MTRFLSLIVARNKEFYRDKGVLAWNFLFPFLVIVGFSFAFSRDNQEVFKVALHGPVGRTESEKLAAGTPGLADFLETRNIAWVPVATLDDATAKLRRHAFDLVVSDEGGQAHYWVNRSSPKGYLTEKLLLGAFASHGTPAPRRETVEGREIRYVDWLIAGLLAMNMMFSALFGVGYNLVRYRKTGVLKRLKATPLGAFEFLTAQVVSRLLIIAVSSAIIYVGCNLAVRFTMLGSYLDLTIVLMSGAICLISLGLLVAARIASEEFAGGLLNLISWPMIFLSGVWFSLEGAAPWVKKVALVFPLTHVIDGARAIMTEGATLAQVMPHVGALLGMGTVFLVVGAATFRWQ